MSTSSVSLTVVVGTLSEVCHSTSPKTRGQTMATLEQFEGCDNYVTSLIRVIDVHDVGEKLSPDCRHLAAVLLKNVVGKRGKATTETNLRKEPCTAFKPLCSEERATLKAFLVRYQEDPSCRVALQLSICTAKLAQQDGDHWLREWPELIPSLVASVQANYHANQSTVVTSSPAENSYNSASFIRSVRGVTTLNEVLQQLSQRASVATAASPFCKSYAALCSQLYPVISKVWGENMKKVQQHLTKLNAQAASRDFANFGTNITGASQAELESLLVHVVLLSKVLRVVLEFGFEAICAAHASFFRSFWRCYMGGVRILADFVRKHRPFSAALRQTSPYKPSACGCSGSFQSALLVCMKAQVMADDDVDDMCDAYVPLELASNSGQTDLLAFINLSLKLIKSLVCAPVILQRRYPLLLLPCLGCMLEYYHTLLCEEYASVAAQSPELSVLQLSLGGGAAAEGLSQEQKRGLYSAQLLRDALPLNYLVKASAMFLANVLTCCGYSECNMYVPVRQQVTSCGGAEEDAASGALPSSGEAMEESAAVKADVAGACDLRKAFFNTERVTQLLRMLLFPMLTYCDKELAVWGMCPEDFVLSQDATAECSSVKAASEKLFCGLMDFATDTLCAALCPMLMDSARQEVLLSPPPACVPCPLDQYLINRELRLYDAVYMCTGLGVGSLAPYMCALKRRHQELSNGCKERYRQCAEENFGAAPVDTAAAAAAAACAGEDEEGATHWVRHYLGPMVQQLLVSPTAGCLLPHKQQLLRARLVWLLSIWMHKLDLSVLPHVLKILTDIIGPAGDSDVVVKMHAIQALQALINLEHFDISQLKFHVVSAVEALCLLVRQLEESDCKVTVLEVAGELISLLSVQMTALKPLVQPLAGYLENLWSESAPSDPSRNAILTVMKGLVKAAKHNAASILSVTVPLISLACNTHCSDDPREGLSTSSRCLSGSTRTCTCNPAGGRPCTCAARGANAEGSNSGDVTGFLVRDGVALWLAVMRNLTEEQYAQYHTELQRLFCAAISGLHIGGARFDGKCDSINTAADAGSRGSRDWDLLTDPDSEEITRNLLLVVEAYALLGGESTHSLLLHPPSHAAVTALYCKILGPSSTEPRMVRFVVRPLQAFLLSSPMLAGQYLSECGILAQLVRVCLSGVACIHLSTLFAPHKQSDVVVTAYLTLVAQLLLFNPAALFAALTSIKAEVLAYVQQTTGHADDKMLTEGILVIEIANLMIRLFDSLAYAPAPVYTAKLWSLALLSLLPPTMLDNKPATPPGSVTSSRGTAPAQRPDCIMGRMILAIMNTLQFTIGRAKLEQFQRDHCCDSASSSSSAPPPVDYNSLCFWFPSTLSADQLYCWVAPLVRVCKGVLQQERDKKSTLRMRRELAVLISMGGDEGMGDACEDEDSDSECSDDEGGCEDSERAGSYDASMRASSGSEHGSSGDSSGRNQGRAITAQGGDSQRLDVATEPIALVHKARMVQSGLLAASMEAHLTVKFTQLCRTLGEEQFATLHCIGDLGL